MYTRESAASIVTSAFDTTIDFSEPVGVGNVRFCWNGHSFRLDLYDLNVEHVISGLLFSDTLAIMIEQLIKHECKRRNLVKELNQCSMIYSVTAQITTMRSS